MVGSLASPNALVLGVLPLGHSGDAGGADPAVAALTAVG